MITPVMPTYARTDFALERGEGAYLYATDGRRYLDFGAGIAVAALGHCHPALTEALKGQAETLWHCSNLYRIEGQEAVAKRLTDNSFADTVFFCNSGAEAVECAFKVVRRHFALSGAAERYRVIACEGGFHGRTLATIAAAGAEKYRSGFGPLDLGFDHVPFGNLNAARAAVGPETAAVLVEPVQGEGGIRPAPEGYLSGLRAMCDEFGLLLVFDEVQSGIGRTGTLFAHEAAGVTPDVLASAKGLGGGFPVGACLATEAAASDMTPGTHGSTYGGNPLAMAVVGAVLDTVLAPGFLDNVTARAAQLMDGLSRLVARHPGLLAEVRGSGLMIGLKCQGDGQENLALVDGLVAEGVLTVPAGDNVVRLVPPLVITEAHVNEFLSALERALDQRILAEGKAGAA